MSKSSKFSLLFSGLFAVSVVITRLILTGWHPYMWIPFGISILLFLSAVIRDWRMMFEFFTLRTTKHGMNMGGIILTMLVFLTAANYLAIKNGKKWDWTSEGINSLSDQSIQVARSLKTDVDLVLLYRKGENDETLKQTVTSFARMYSDVSDKFHLKIYNVLERPDLAQKFEYRTGPFGLYLASSDGVRGPVETRLPEKHLKVEQPTEEDLTRALLRFTRTASKTIYFVSGHGEHDIEAQGPDSISQFKAELEVTYDVKKLELFKDSKVPDDAELVIIAGPQKGYLPGEIDGLRDYAKRGGRLLIAIDPGEKHGLAGLTKTFGVEFANDFVLDSRAEIPGAGKIAALGTVFSQSSPVTKMLNGKYAVFIIASSLKKAPDLSKDITLEELVKTDEIPNSMERLTLDSKVVSHGPHTLAMFSKGKLPGGTGEFEVIVFGDADFFRNTIYGGYVNRDLMMNSVASLAQDVEKVTIRPKVAKGTRLEMSETQLMIVLFGFLLPLPIIMMFTSGLLWWRRRAA